MPLLITLPHRVKISWRKQLSPLICLLFQSYNHVDISFIFASGVRPRYYEPKCSYCAIGWWQTSIEYLWRDNCKVRGKSTRKQQISDDSHLTTLSDYIVSVMDSWVLNTGEIIPTDENGINQTKTCPVWMTSDRTHRSAGRCWQPWDNFQTLPALNTGLQSLKAVRSRMSYETLCKYSFNSTNVFRDVFWVQELTETEYYS